MKITVRQLKQLIREQVEDERDASEQQVAGPVERQRLSQPPRRPRKARRRVDRNRSLKDFVKKLGVAQGWFDDPARGRSVENVKDVFIDYIDDDVLVIEFKNGDTLEEYISDL